jgi:hypothetical protein
VDTEIDGCLDTWGISLLDEWDVLVFLHRHQTTLTDVERMGALLGYSKPVVSKALEKLETAGLVRRSRPSRGVRLYQLVSSVDSSRQACFELLLKLIEKPTVRGLISRRLVHSPIAGRKLRRLGLYLM